MLENRPLQLKKKTTPFDCSLSADLIFTQGGGGGEEVWTLPKVTGCKWEEPRIWILRVVYQPRLKH